MPTDKRGYPVPYIVVRDTHGVPRFQINDDRKVETCLAHKVCAICGNKMESDMWLVGGPMSAFHANGAYIDSAAHHECLEYALKVCPYLVLPNYLARLDVKNVKEGDFSEHMIFQNNSQDDTRVPFFVAIHIRDFRVTRPRLGERYIIPDRNYIAVEYWNGGEIITPEAAAVLMQDHLNNPKSGVK